MSADDRPQILIVEDDKDVRDSVAALLDALGFETRAAGDGREALQLLRATVPRPCLVLLDLAMPVMNGEEFLRHQAADAALADIPVILVSANTDLVEKAASLNVAGALHKPVSLGALDATLARYCARI